jgi:hypothetical protein
MNETPGVCAACGNGTAPGLRFCTRCGASLITQPADDPADRAAREVRNRAIFLAVRGAFTLLLSVPFMLICIVAAMSTVPVLMLALALMLGWLAVLGWRDLARALRISTDGAAAMAEWKAMGGQLTKPAAPEALPPRPERGSATRKLEGEAPPSVTEHTTFHLDDRRDRDHRDDA